MNQFFFQKVSLHLIAAGAVLLSGAPSVNRAEEARLDWPQFRGPSGAGHSVDEVPAPVEFGLNKNVEWSLEVPEGHSSPCVAGDRVFLTGFEKEGQKLLTVCIDRKTGKMLWKKERPVKQFEKHHDVSTPATATATTDGKFVFAYFASYGLTAYDMEGREIWTKAMPIAVNRMGFGSGTSPIVAGKLVLLDVHAGPDSHLLALRCEDGETAWKGANPLFNDGWSTPVVWSEGDEDVVGMLNAGKFSVRRLKDGSEKWWLTGLPNQTCATPSVGNGVVYISGVGVLGEKEELIRPPKFDELISKYDSNQDGRISIDEIPDTILVADRKSSGGAGNMTLKQFLTFFSSNGKSPGFDRADWEKGLAAFDDFGKGAFMTTRVMAVRMNGKGEVGSTGILWSESKGIPEVPSALLLGKRLYFVKAGGTAICRDAETGRVIYEERLGAPGGYYASPVAGAGRLYAASDRGMVVVFEAGDSLKVLARNDLREPIMATPAIVHGNLIVRTAHHLYSFRQEKI